MILPTDLDDAYLQGLINVKSEEEGTPVHLNSSDLKSYLDPSLPPDELRRRTALLSDLRRELEGRQCTLNTPFLSRAAAAFLQGKSPCVRLPPEAEQVGFKLTTLRDLLGELKADKQAFADYPVLLIPMVGVPSFFPSVDAKTTMTPDDCFTRLDFDTATNTLTLET